MNLANEFERLKKLRDAGAITAEEFDASKTRLLDECVLRIESVYDHKPMVWRGWGLPPVKVVRGLVQTIRFSSGDDGDTYAAFMTVEGQRVEISSPSPILIDAGHRVTLGGYEREGRVLALAYHNESEGTYSDLTRLRKGYRLLITIGLASLLAGLVAVVASVAVPVLLKRMGAFDSESWRIFPYVR